MTDLLYLETLLLLWQEVECAPSGLLMYRGLLRCAPEAAESLKSFLVGDDADVDGRG